MNEELRLWTVGKSGEVERLPPVTEMPTELALEDLLVRNPEMLEADLQLVGRQTPTETGWLDLLAVDRDGRLVVYELKRGTLVREAVTQVLDYASYLDSMSIADLAEHIAERSGNDGIQGIEDFEQWYAANFGGGDLSRLLPPRMVLIGLGVDTVLERMVRFISRGPVDVSVVTFHGFLRGRDRLLARQMEVGPSRSPVGNQRRDPTVAEMRQALEEHLEQGGYKNLFELVRGDVRQSLPERGVKEELRKNGVSFKLNDLDNSRNPKTYFGVYAEHDGPGVYSVSILPRAIRWGQDAFEKLKESIDFNPWTYGGGHYFSFVSEDEWDELRPALLGFVKEVLANRSGASEPET